MARTGLDRTGGRSDRPRAWHSSLPSPWLALILAWLPLQTFAASTTTTASTSAFVRPVDLRNEASALSERRIPLVVLFSQTACAWCDRARQQLLVRAREEHGDAIALFRQIDIDSTDTLTDFDGKVMSHRDFAQGQGVRFTPTLVFYGPHGKRLAKPILGMRLPDFYAQYVEQAIADARTRLPQPG